MRDPIVEAEDEDFLSQVAAVEADALCAKRRKISTTVTTATNLSKPERNTEGAYTAALRGSRSLSFQQQSGRSNGRLKVVVADNQIVFANPEFGAGSGGGSAGGGGGSCFKCGKSGHWARDCDANPYAFDSSVPEKACPCGLGTCIVLTANTERNRGRKFYKCPLREENKGCGFFEWCDINTGTDNTTVRSQSHASNPSISYHSCPCGAGICLILTAKTGKNIGQQFYRCPANQGSSCGFFKWCHDHTIADSSSVLVNSSMVYKTNEMSNKSFGIKSGSSCFRCGKDGHWAKDCLLPSTQKSADLGGNSSSSSTCYKCGIAGHWAKDCSSSKEVQARLSYPQFATNVAKQSNPRIPGLRPVQGNFMGGSRGCTVNTHPKFAFANTSSCSAPILTDTTPVISSVDYPAIGHLQRLGSTEAPQFDVGEFVSRVHGKRPCLEDVSGNGEVVKRPRIVDSSAAGKKNPELVELPLIEKIEKGSTTSSLVSSSEVDEIDLNFHLYK